MLLGISTGMNEVRMTPMKIRKALISVSDKTDIIKISKILVQIGCEIISTGGTKKKLEKAGIKITDISSVPGNPEAFSGRMKTISFNIESALLFDRKTDSMEAAELGIEPIDMVICNLYPFKKVSEEGVELEELIENIDIGGPTMIRAAAKNYAYVTVVTDVGDYDRIINELKENQGSISCETRYELMRKAFNYTADYDDHIAQTLDHRAGIKSLRFSFHQGKNLRYGENSHQQGLFFREANAQNSLANIKILHGKEISYNNLTDIQSGMDAVGELSASGCAIIKHNNPCGFAQGKDQLSAFELAWAGDPISAFGSVIAFNEPLQLKTAQFLQLDNKDKSKRKFVEVIISPSFSSDVLDYLKFHKNLRIIEYDISRSSRRFEIKYLCGSLLWQDTDNILYKELRLMTDCGFNLESEQGLIEFGLKAVKHVRSNAIVIVREHNSGYYQLLGMGAGQPNRLIATHLAVDKARENLIREYSDNELGSDQKKREDYIKRELGKAILISDAFFPFPDNVEVAADSGIKKIVEPGGSIRDKAVINCCRELSVSLIFSGIRHFKH